MEEINQNTCCKQTQSQTCQDSSASSTENTALQQCKAQLEEAQNKFLRVQADLDNFSRRVEKEKTTWIRVGQATLLKDILSIVDDMERAFSTKQENITPEMQQWLSGFELIAKGLTKFLATHGVTEISQMKTFDPNLHEALMQVPSPEHHKAGDIIQVLQKGYEFKGEVLRPAKVSVAQ